MFCLVSDEVLLQSAVFLSKRTAEWESVKLSARANSFHSRIELDFVIYGSHLDSSFAVRGCDPRPLTLRRNQNLPLQLALFLSPPLLLLITSHRITGLKCLDLGFGVFGGILGRSQKVVYNGVVNPLVSLISASQRER